MSESARPLTHESSDQGPGFLEKFKRLFAPQDGDAEAVREVIAELIEERSEDRPAGEAAIDPNERLLLANVLKLRDVTAADIMVPRADVLAVEASTPVSEALARLVKEGHSRLPVYRETLDDVIGLVHIKDLAILAVDQINGEVDRQPISDTLSELVRSVLFVSPAVRVLDMLLEMRMKRAHMAMVVDEYGGIDGLVTIEDVVEQIVGEIEDEHDNDQAPELTLQDDSSLIADARVTLGDFEARVGKLFSEEEHESNDTIGGLVTSLAGRVPARGELVRHPSGIEFEVLHSDPRLIRRVRVRDLPAASPPA